MDSFSNVPVCKNHLAAHAWWLKLGSSSIEKSIANYHTIAGNGCLDGRVFVKKGTGETVVFEYKDSSSVIDQSDCDDLAAVLHDIQLAAKRFVLDAREKFVRAKAAEFGFIKEGQSFEVLQNALRQMTKEQLTRNKEKMSELTTTERNFVREQCLAFCKTANINVVITNKNYGFAQKEITELVKPQRNWSGHALYVISMEVTKQIYKKIAKCTKDGNAGAAVMKRVKREVSSSEENDEQPPMMKSRRVAFQVVDFNGTNSTNEMVPRVHSNADLKVAEIHEFIEKTRSIHPNDLLNKIKDLIHREGLLLLLMLHSS
jgi:hypothetical protein